MTNQTPITCEQLTEKLRDFLDRDIDESTRLAVEAHAIVCAECGSLVADLRRLRIEAANLPELVPSRDLWSGIQARIATPVIELQGHAALGARRPRRVSQAVWMGLAAAGLVGITAGITHMLTKHALTDTAQTRFAAQTQAPASTAPAAAPAKSAVPGASVPAPAPAPTSVSPTSRSPSTNVALVSTNARPSALTAEETYALEIASLTAIVKQRRAQLDPLTVGTVERNLKIVDDAIAQIKRALLKDPASRFLIESLNSALENKVEVLRTAATLPLRT